jgi:hypothetical protein
MTQTVIVNEREVVVQTSQVVNNIIQDSSKLTTIVHGGMPGLPGPQGEPGESNIGGYPFEITNISNNHTLAFSFDKWINKAQEDLTDGGNF